MANLNEAPATAAGIRAALVEQLHQAVAARATAIEASRELGIERFDGESQSMHGAMAVRELAEALRAVDAVAIVERQASKAPAIDYAALATDLWNVTQEAGGSTAVGDAVVARLRELAAGGTP